MHQITSSTEKYHIFLWEGVLPHTVHTPIQ